MPDFLALSSIKPALLPATSSLPQVRGNLTDPVHCSTNENQAKAEMATRRQFTALLAGTVLCALGPRHAQAAQQPGEDLVVGFDGAAIVKFVLDPHNSLFAPHNRVMRSIFDNLVVLQPDQSVGPWLAKAWEISPDRKSYTFQLRTDVTFHDGTRFDAAAVKANFDRIKDPKNALYSFSEIGPYAGAEVLSDDRVRIILTEPFEPLLRNLSSTKLGIVSPSAVAKYGDIFGQNPIGTGPFRFIDLTQGTDIRLERNPDYNWAPTGAAHVGPAYLDKLSFKNIPEQATRVAALQSGQVHVVDLIPSQYLQAIKSDPNFRLLQKELLNTNYSLTLNVAKAPWDDEEIRQAVRLSLDIGGIVRAIYLGTAPRAWSSLSPSLFASAEKDLTDSWKPDPKQAAAILDRKGWRPGADGIRVKDGKRLVISYLDTQGNREQRLDVIQLARRQLAKNGIGLTIDSQALGAYFEKVAHGEYDLVAGAQFADDPDVLRQYFVPASRSVLTGVRVDDAEITQWLTEAAVEDDLAKRAELYKKAQHKLIEKAYAIPVYVLLYNLATTTKVSGVFIDTHGFPNFHEAKLNASAEVVR
jgi:peptide/nickel transport system substrate-binding protein